MPSIRKLWPFAFVVLGLAASFVAGSWLTWRTVGVKPTTSARKVLYWVDSMHPAYKSDKPGIAPDCGMQLEPVYADDPSAASGSAPPPGAIRVDARRQQAIGVRVGQIEPADATRRIRTVGRVVVDENRVYRMVAATDGIVRELRPVFVGHFVQKDQVLLSFSSREFLGAQQAYFYALNTLDRITRDSSEPTDQAALTRDQVRAAADGLQALGMSDIQVAALAQVRKPVSTIDLRSPVSGYILARGVSPAQRFDRGTEFYRVADLSRVWVLADLYEDDARFVVPGTHARVTVRYFPTAAVDVVVDDVLPQFDPATRTFKLRLEAPNPGAVLRPDVIADVELSIRRPAVVTVPTDALVESGKRTTVFVDRGNGYFEPRRVEKGWRFDDRVEILRGLTPGERIVLSGNFLIDSESRMRAAAMGIVTPETDPVCGMEVDSGRASAARRTVEHGGQTYYFCSDTCRTRFLANPAGYITPPATAAAAPRWVSARPAGSPGSTSPAIVQPSLESVELPGFATGRTIFRKDPVCGADVDTTAANALKSIYNGSTFYFLTEECRAEFLKSPGQYAIK